MVKGRWWWVCAVRLSVTGVLQKVLARNEGNEDVCGFAPHLFTLGLDAKFGSHKDLSSCRLGKYMWLALLLGSELALRPLAATSTSVSLMQGESEQVGGAGKGLIFSLPLLISSPFWLQELSFVEANWGLRDLWRGSRDWEARETEIAQLPSDPKAPLLERLRFAVQAEAERKHYLGGRVPRVWETASALCRANQKISTLAQQACPSSGGAGR